MTLDEAIKRCDEVAEEMFANAVYIMDKMKSDVALCNAERCRKCAEEHRQLAEWLKELKGYREAKAKIESLPLAWEYGQGVEDCLAIIDKHLQEVRQRADCD